MSRGRRSPPSVGLHRVRDKSTHVAARARLQAWKGQEVCRDMRLGLEGGRRAREIFRHLVRQLGVAFEQVRPMGRQILVAARTCWVIDEAGMGSSKQLRAAFVGAAERRERSWCWVGDPEQLQPITRTGRRPGGGRSASALLSLKACAGKGKTGSGWRRRPLQGTGRRKVLGAYAQRGGVRLGETREEAGAEIVARCGCGHGGAARGSRIVLAHRRPMYLS